MKKGEVQQYLLPFYYNFNKGNLEFINFMEMQRKIKEVQKETSVIRKENVTHFLKRVGPFVRFGESIVSSWREDDK